uniref:Uncharacterized protein n=1 Tax=Moniliophthora roreri TaxID=221103 RepID=A0A0W0F707_MONRR
MSFATVDDKIRSSQDFSGSCLLSPHSNPKVEREKKQLPLDKKEHDLGFSVMYGCVAQLT